MTQYGPEWKEQRKFMKEVLGGEATRRHDPLLEEEGLYLLRDIFEDPTKFDRHLRRQVLDNIHTRNQDTDFVQVFFLCSPSNCVWVRGYEERRSTYTPRGRNDAG